MLMKLTLGFTTYLNSSLIQIFGGENGDSFFVGLRGHIKATGRDRNEPTRSGRVHDEVVLDLVHVVVGDDADVVGSQVDAAPFGQHQVPKCEIVDNDLKNHFIGARKNVAYYLDDICKSVERL